MLINKNDTPITAAVHIDGNSAFGSAHLYALTGASPLPEDRGALTAVGKNDFSVPMPKYSVMTMVVD